MPKRAHTIDRPFIEGEIECVILASESFKRKAMYALEALLRPAGLLPVEAEPESTGLAGASATDAGRKGIWYGSEAPSDENWLFVQLDPDTPQNITSSLRGAAPPSSPAPFLFPGGINDAGDPIASAFYWLAGCDYHANPQRDQYGRATRQGSLLDALGLADAAPVDQYSEHLATFLGVSQAEAPSPWSLCPTFDIDYLRKWRPGILYREFVEYALLGRGSVPRLPRAAASLREAVSPGDPYRTALERIQAELEKTGGTGTFFFKGGATSAHDVGYSLKGRFVRSRLRALATGRHEIGLHPSFHAYNHPGYLAKETGALARATGASPTTVRTHYLRWEEPATPRHMLAHGFRLDSTLGFPDGSGFRNGTCRPFRVWDHDAVCALDLWELPLAMMESSLFNRENLNAEQALSRTRSLMSTARQFGGALVCLWHNVLWDEPDFAGWGEHFVGTLEAGRAEGAQISSLSTALSRFA